MAGQPPTFSIPISPSSAASGGNDIIDAAARDWATGDITVGDGNDQGGANSWVTGLVRDVTVGLIVAVAARYLWGMIK